MKKLLVVSCLAEDRFAANVKYLLANHPEEVKAGAAKIKAASNGKITVKKGLKKGTYKVKVRLTASKSANYTAAKAKAVYVTIKIK